MATTIATCPPPSPTLHAPHKHMATIDSITLPYGHMTNTLTPQIGSVLSHRLSRNSLLFLPPLVTTTILSLLHTQVRITQLQKHIKKPHFLPSTTSAYTQVRTRARPYTYAHILTHTQTQIFHTHSVLLIMCWQVRFHSCLLQSGCR